MPDTQRRPRDRTARSTVVRFAGLVLAAALLCGALLAGVYALRDPAYTSEATLLFSRSDPSQALTGRPSVPLAVDSLEDVVSDQVAVAAADRLGTTVEDLREATAVEPGESGSTLLVTGDAPTAEGAREVVQALGDAFIETERAAATQSLTQQAEALDQPIADIQTAIDDAPAVDSPEEQLARTSQLQQLADLQSTQRRLLAAASQYPGQIQYLTQPDLPRSPSSFTPVQGLLQGVVLGLLGGALLGYAFRDRFVEERPRRHAPSQQAEGVGSPHAAGDLPRSRLPHGEAPA